MRAKPVPSDEQYRLILECRASGLSDFQWCKEHGIKPGTFYNWLKRLRQKGCEDVPAATRGKGGTPTKQDVVKLDFQAAAGLQSTSPVIPTGDFHDNAIEAFNVSSIQPFIEVVLSDTIIRIPPGADSAFIERVIRTIKAAAC